MQAAKQRLIILLTVFFLFLSFYALLPLEASADGTVISKILTTLSASPVALDDPASITVATSTPGCYISSAGWFDSSGQVVSGAFDTETYTLVINIGANEGYTIDSDVACYLNNSAVSCVVDSSGRSAVLTRDYSAAVWAPTVYKNPGDETVNEGGWASFVVSAAYAKDYEWSLVNPAGTSTIPVANLKNSYSTIEYKGNNSPKLNLYHIPYDLNGWKVVCDFIGAGAGNVKRSQPATITVIPTVSSVPASPEPDTPVSPSVEPVNVTSPVTSSESEQQEEEKPAQSNYSDTWSYDARGHWHASLDGSSAADEDLHSFIWTEVRPESDTEAGLEEGVCAVCGYTATRRFGGPSITDTEDKSDGNFFSRFLDGFKLDLYGMKPPSIQMALLIALIPIDLVLIIVHLCGGARQRRRRRRRRR